MEVAKTTRMTPSRHERPDTEIATQNNPAGNARADFGATLFTYGDNYFDGAGGCSSCTAISKG